MVMKAMAFVFGKIIMVKNAKVSIRQGKWENDAISSNFNVVQRFDVWWHYLMNTFFDGLQFI